MDVTENLLDEWLWQKKSWFKKDAEKPLPLYNVHSRRENQYKSWQARPHEMTKENFAKM